MWGTILTISGTLQCGSNRIHSNPIGTGLKTGDVDPEVRDMMLLSARLRVWNPDVVVPPTELRCHGRRLMVQSLSAIHASLHRSYSPIAIIWLVESAER